MGGSSTPTGSTTTNTTSTAEPWGAQKPFLETGFQQAESNVLNRPLDYFPDSTVVPFSPESQASLGAQTSRATQGSPLLGQAQGYTGDVLGGQFLDPSTNPFFGGMTDSVMSAVRPGVDSMFAGGGRAGSPAHAEALGRGVSRGMAPFLFNEYGRERGFQQDAANLAPGLAREDYFDIGQLGDVGAAREQKSQEGLAEEIARFNFGQSEPTNRIAQFMNLIQGSYGGTSTASQTAQQGANSALLGGGAGLSLLGK
ncbi:hypothetical protein LCGC14_3069130 [marine sediment metagenome]|uniref:Uncharacterized protein n=1 Tax=marine sediment metagenome TaxID=412755 RepID=A0A0F8X4Z5_9ZZZZ